MRQYIEVKSGTGALGGQAKFANDYMRRPLSRAITDGELLRKNGELDGSSMQIIAQAYYLLARLSRLQPLHHEQFRQRRGRGRAAAADALRL